MKRIRIGLGQLLVEGGEPIRNLQRASKMIAEAAEKKCDIILLPETLDLAWTHPSAKEEAQPIPGPYSEILCEEARKNNIYICAGLTESWNGKVFNTAVFIDPNGELLLKYNKINLLVVEQDFYEVGRTLNVLDTPFGLIGINICADNYMDGIHIGHSLARMGAQLILSPSSWTVDYSKTEVDDPYGDKWLKPYQTLAELYNLAIVGTTSVGVIVGGPYEGKKMIGCSLAVGPQGILAQGQFNEFTGDLVVTEFDIPERPEKGTAISERLIKKGYRFA